MTYQEENKTGLWIAMAVSIALAPFTIWRAWDLLTLLLPADQNVAAVFGIAALDGGMTAWVAGYMKAKGSDQRRIAGVMAVLDFLGVGAATALDLTLSAWHKGLIQAPTNLYMAAIILISAAVVANVGAAWLYAVNDPKKKAEMQDQKAHDKINDMAAAQIERNAAMYAPAFASVKVQAWLGEAAMLHGVVSTNDFGLPPSSIVSGQLAPPSHATFPPLVPPQAAPPTMTLPRQQQSPAPSRPPFTWPSWLPFGPRQTPAAEPGQPLTLSFEELERLYLDARRQQREAQRDVPPPPTPPPPPDFPPSLPTTGNQ